MVLPISGATYDTLCQRWAKSINNLGSFAIDIWFPIGGANMRVKQFLLDSKQQSKYIYSPSSKLTYVDLAESQGIFAQDIKEQFAFSLQISSSFDEWILKNQEPIVFFILGLDTSLRSGIAQGIDYISEIIKQYPFISCILFTEIDIDLFKVTSSFINYQKLYTPEDCLQFYAYLEEKWNFIIPSRLSSQLFKHFGGHFLLLKETARLIFAKPTISLEEILKAPSLNQKSKAIFQRLNSKDQDIILNVLQKKPTEVSPYLQETGLVSSGQIGIPYWDMIRGELINSNYSQNNFDFLLTAPEREVFELLSEKNSIISRDMIAQTLWQNKWEDKYSDWAIDQLIHRIREKIEKTKVPYEILTKKGEGFYLEKNIRTYPVI